MKLKGNRNRKHLVEPELPREYENAYDRYRFLTLLPTPFSLAVLTTDEMEWLCKFIRRHIPNKNPTTLAICRSCGSRRVDTNKLTYLLWYALRWDTEYADPIIGGKTSRLPKRLFQLLTVKDELPFEELQQRMDTKEKREKRNWLRSSKGTVIYDEKRLKPFLLFCEAVVIAPSLTCLCMEQWLPVRHRPSLFNPSEPLRFQ